MRDGCLGIRAGHVRTWLLGRPVRKAVWGYVSTMLGRIVIWMRQITGLVIVICRGNPDDVDQTSATGWPYQP